MYKFDQNIIVANNLVHSDARPKLYPYSLDIFSMESFVSRGMLCTPLC